jgi:FolB domain-containing protein
MAVVTYYERVTMDQVLIKDLTARGVIGISDAERSQPQDIVINITLFTDISQGALTDNIEDCVNYRTVSKKVLQLAQTNTRFTVEALAQDIANLCLSEEKVSSVRVRVEKPGAVRFSRSVGVEIERSRII